jgi:DNA polymerase-3 subunit beta
MFTVNRTQLEKELAVLQSVAEKKGTMPVLSNVMIDVADKLTLFATNLDASVISTIDVAGERWTGCLPMAELTKFVRLAESDELVFQVKETRMQVKAGKAKCLLPITDREHFPVLPQLTSEGGLTLPGDTLRMTLTRLLPCATTEESRWALRGVKFEAKDGTLNLIATNGHRMGLASLSVAGEIDKLIPVDGLAPLLKTDAETITFNADDNHAWFRCGHRLIVTRMLVGQFPRWEMIWPKEMPYRLEVTSETMVAAFRRVEITRNTTRDSAARLTFDHESLTVDSGETDRGQCDERLEAACNLNGETVLVGLNPDYVMDFLRHAGGRVKCEFRDSNSVVLFSDGSGFQYIIQPMRL